MKAKEDALGCYYGFSSEVDSDEGAIKKFIELITKQQMKALQADLIKKFADRMDHVDSFI